MTHTITALFDNRHDAEAAQERLKQSSVDASHIHIHDKSSAGYDDDTGSSPSTGSSTGSGQGATGIWQKIRNVFLPHEDRHAYEEGVRRGGYLLSADVDDDAVGAAVQVLEEADTVDIDDRASEWRASGWDAAPSLTDTLLNEDGSTRAIGRRDLDRGHGRVRSYTDAPFSQD